MQLSRSTVPKGTASRTPGWTPTRMSQRRPKPFTGARRHITVQAAAESEEAAEPAPQQPQQQRQKRAQRVVTVPIATIQPGQELEGTVTKVEAYGAFVSVGAESDGLVHISQLADGYVKNTADFVKIGDKVKVKVLTVDTAQRRLALTMKGLGNARSGGAGGARAAAAAESFDADDADEGEAEEAFALEAGDVALDGVVFRVDDGEGADADGYDEADEFEEEAEGEVALAAALENSLVEGKVTGVEDFGVIVEWTSADGAKRSGLLHVSEMRAPAAAAEAELAAAGAEEEAEEGEEGGGLLADEGEYAAELYVDVGGIDKPSQYYKVGDAISCFVLGLEGTKVELTQDLSSLALDDAVDEEGEEFDYEEERLLARAEADEDAAISSFEEDEGADADEEVVVTSAGDATAAVYYSQSNSAAKVAAAPAFIRGKRGAAVAPAAFPSRGFAVSDSDLRVAAAKKLIDVDDAGDEAELVDYWTDDVGRIGKGRLAALGAKIVVGEEGELAVVAREGAEEGQEEADVLELLSGVSDAALDGLVDDILADDDEDEAELPFLARRNPSTAA